jgi:hypothetical protein
MIKKLMKWLITFDEYIYVFIFMFILLMVMSIIDHFRIYGITNGSSFLLKILVYGFGIFILLHIYQSIGRFLGFDKNYFRIKKEIIAKYKKFNSKKNEDIISDNIKTKCKG